MAKTTKKPTAKQIAARKKFAAMAKARAKAAKAKKPTAKKTAVKKTSTYQTGSSNKLYDKRKVAKDPGKRVTEDGSVYYERRKNRSDMPGSILGIGEISLNDIGLELLELDSKIQYYKQKKKQSKTKTEKSYFQNYITVYTNQHKNLKLYLNSRAKFV